MDRETYIDEMTARIRKMVADAYDHGAAAGAEGEAALKKTIMSVLGVTPEPSPTRTFRAKLPRKGGLPKIRAPKGAVSEAIARVFLERDGMTTKEIEGHVLYMNPSINPKTVYNELWRRKDMYRQDGGRWFLAGLQDAPPADLISSMNGSAGGHGAGALASGEHGARAPAAAGEVRGT